MWGKLTSIFGLIAIALAAAAISRHKATAQKWQQTAIDEKENDVTAGTSKAAAALAQAKLHNARAREAKEKARQRIDKLATAEPGMSEIVNGWRRDRIK